MLGPPVVVVVEVVVGTTDPHVYLRKSQSDSLEVGGATGHGQVVGHGSLTFVHPPLPLPLNTQDRSQGGVVQHSQPGFAVVVVVTPGGSVVVVPGADVVPTGGRTHEVSVVSQAEVGALDGDSQVQQDATAQVLKAKAHPYPELDPTAYQPQDPEHGQYGTVVEGGGGGGVH